MGSISRTLRELPPESRERVENWVSSQSWGESSKAKSSPAVDETGFPALS